MGGPQQEKAEQAGKVSVRAAVRSRRRTRTLDERADAADALARTVMTHLDGVGRSDVVAAYVSTPTEPGTEPLRRALADAGVTVLLPVVDAVAGRPLAWVVDGVDGVDDVDGSESSLVDADLVLLPALAVTASGHRLGQGGGHYDRTLAGLLRPSASPGTPARRPLLVALVHEDEVRGDGAWPVEEHDVRVDAVATPSGWTHLPPIRLPKRGP